MKIYSIQNKKNYEVRKMTPEERNRRFGEDKNYIISCDLLTGEEMGKRIIEAENKYLLTDCYIYQRPGHIPLIFSEIDKMKTWVPVPENGKLF
jgi:hypothetical protein